MQSHAAMEKELRHRRSTLRTFGMGMIIFTLWAMLKPVLVALVISPETGRANVAEDLDALSNALAETGPIGWVVLALMFLFILMIAFLRLYLGFSARAEGLGQRRGNLYVIITFLFFIIQAALFAAEVFFLMKTGTAEKSALETAASLIVELTSTVTTGELAFTAVTVKRLDRQLRQDG